MKENHPKKDKNKLKGKLPPISRGHAFGSAGSGRGGKHKSKKQYKRKPKIDKEE